MELNLWRLSLNGNLDVQRERLERALKLELQLELISQAIKRGDEGKEAALILILQATPVFCI